MYFTNQHALTLCERQVYTSGKSTFTAVAGVTGAIYMRTLNEEQAAVNGIQWGQAYSGVVENSLDIQVGDRITVDTKVYIVKGVADNARGTICDYKKVLLTKPAV